MSRSWTPESQVSITDAGMVIKIKMERRQLAGLRTTFNDGQLCIRRENDEFGPFEVKFAVPSGYNPGKLKVTFIKGILRIEIPPGKYQPFLSDFPKSMLIYCEGCGKHFDIVITGNRPGDYTCPTCGKVQIFDFEAFVKKAVEQSKGMLGKRRGRR